MRLIAYNPSTDNLEKSYLAQSYPAASSTLVTKNTNNFNNGDKLLLGEMGREKSEIVTINTVSGDKITITLTAGTKFPHSADDPVYDLRYDQINFYRSTSGAGGSYSLLASVPVDVDNADKCTYYNDNAGLSSYFYEISFYSNPTAIESSLSDQMAGEGYTRAQIGRLIGDFLEEAGDLDQTYVTMPQVLAWLNECNDDLTYQSNRPYRFLRKNPSWTLSTVAGENRISLPDDMTFVDYIQYNYDYGFLDKPEIAIVDLHDINERIAYDGAVVNNSDELRMVAIDPETFELVLWPTPLNSQTDVMIIHGWTNFNEFTGLADNVQTPNSRIYKMFLLSKFWKIRSIKDGSNNFKALSQAYNTDYTTEIVKMQRIMKIDKGTPTGMKPDMRRYRHARVR